MEWISAIPLAEWPQQHRVDAQLRPAMVNDLGWHGFGTVTSSLVDRIASLMPGCEPFNRMLSVVMPGHAIDPHCDAQEPSWVTRVHVPLLTNPRATVEMAGTVYRLCAGQAYSFDTRVEHIVRNYGDTPRIHFMFDVRRA